MKNLILLFSLIGLFLFTACHKKDEFENKTVIEGFILEYGSKEPIIGLPIYLVEFVSGDLFGPQVWRNTDTIYTDETGYVYFEYNHNNMTLDLCTFEQSDKHFEIKEKVINTRKINDISDLADPYAWLQIHIQNVNPQFGDLLSIGGNWGGGSNWNMFYGSSVDTTVLRKIRGNRRTPLSWLIQRDNINTQLRDTINAPAHDTTFYEILY